MELRINNISFDVEDGKKVGGYINVTERESEILYSQKRNKYFVEVIKKGVFKRALDKAIDNIPLLLEHSWDKKLASLRDGDLTLVEDNIGLKFEARLKDDEVYSKVESRDINSCSFGFRVIKEKFQNLSSKLEKRTIEEIELMEVSLVQNPAYVGSLVETRALSEEDKKKFEEEEKKDADKEVDKNTEKDADKNSKKTDENPNEKVKEDAKETKVDETEVEKNVEKDADKKTDKEADKNANKDVNKDADKETDKKTDDKKSDEDKETEKKPKKDKEENQKRNLEEVPVADKTNVSVIDRDEIVGIIENIISEKMDQIKRLEQEEKILEEDINNVKNNNRMFENELEMLSMANSSEIIKLRCELLKLKQAKDGI